MLTFDVTSYEKFTLIKFAIGDDGILTPAELPGIVAPEVNPAKGVVLSGRGPVWLFAYLAHHYHTTQWVATFDPRMGGAVVTSRHSRIAPAVGSIVFLGENRV